jgi:hypothetical protein
MTHDAWFVLWVPFPGRGFLFDEALPQISIAFILSFISFVRPKEMNQRKGRRK